MCWGGVYPAAFIFLYNFTSVRYRRVTGKFLCDRRICHRAICNPPKTRKKPLENLSSCSCSYHFHFFSNGRSRRFAHSTCLFLCCVYTIYCAGVCAVTILGSLSNWDATSTETAAGFLLFPFYQKVSTRRAENLAAVFTDVRVPVIWYESFLPGLPTI